MNSLWEALPSLTDKVEATFLSPSFLWSAAGLGLIVAFFWAMDMKERRQGRRFLSRTFVTDVFWTLFYAAGFYYFFFSGPLDRVMAVAMHRWAPWLRLELLSPLPALAHWVAVIVLTDGINYWTHRWSHAWGWLWCFHCVHHTPEQLTPLTRFRIHFGDMVFFGVVKFVPMMLIGLSPLLAAAPGLWIPVTLVPVFMQAVSHADVDWGYGWIGKVVVSPRFHRVHHSSDPAQQNTNFGQILSCWDYIFGTAGRALERPAAYGLAGQKPPQSFLGQLAYPFMLLARRAGLFAAPGIPRADVVE